MASNVIVEEVSQIEKLKDVESYQLWNFQLTIMFKANGLYEIVKGESKLESMKSEEEKETWKKKDAKAQKIITTTIERKTQKHKK
ncbi:hypothetical protein QE152_g34158 [Popillia japonica]|uniref:Uncharacterized protein n=1 Tax=Popillia japonica TaxID=7064 RepID=A0AAW1IUW6_POPJA